MKKIVKPFKIAFLVSIVLNLGGIFVTYFYHGGWEEIKQDLVRIYPISFPIFFIPPFFSFYFFKKDKKFFYQFLKPASISFLVIVITVFIAFSTFHDEKKYYNFFPAIFNGIIAFFLSTFFSIIQYVKNNSDHTNIKSINNIQFNYKKIVAIPIVASIIYAIIFYINYGSINYREGNLFFISKFIIPGFIITFTTLFFIKNIYKNRTLKKIKAYIILLYVLSATFFPILTFLDYYMAEHIDLAHFIRILIKIMMIYSPYFLFIISFVHLYFIQLISQQEKEILQQQSLEAQLNYQQLKNQLSPHFLFNNLNVLTGLIEENPKKAIHFSEKLATIYRYFLAQEQQEVVLLKDEIKFAKDYLFLLQNRFEKGLNFTFEIATSSEEKYIVSTTLQQVLENVIKHNEISVENPIEILITTKNDELLIVNNLNPKITSTKGTQKGIENIKKRNAFFSDKKVIVHSNKTHFSIKLPLLNL